VIILKIPG